MAEKTVNIIEQCYKGAGYYDKYDGSLIELGECKRELIKGEVWEGTKQDYLDTFSIH